MVNKYINIYKNKYYIYNCKNIQTIFDFQFFKLSKYINNFENLCVF